MADFLMMYIQVLGIILITTIVVVGLFAGVVYTHVKLEEKLSADWAIGGTTLLIIILLSILLTFLIYFGGVEP